MEDNTLDVLVVQTHPGAADEAVAHLEAAGHRVHRCHEEAATGFPCRGAVDPPTCPLSSPMDVALLVRPRLTPQPTPLEWGSACAIRNRLPLVELGSDLLDPFAPWITRRVGSPAAVPEACAEVAEEALAPLRRAITERIATLLSATGADPSPTTCVLRRTGSDLHVHIEVAGTLALRTEHAISVRVLDAVRTSDKTYGRVDVAVTSSR